MYRRVLRPRWVSAFLLVTACQGGATDQGATETTHPTDSTGSATAGQPTSGTDSGGQDPHAICDRYLVCIAAIAPGELPQAQEGFGENGTCWQGSASEAALCLEACETGLGMYHELFPDQSKCDLCQDHTDCDTAAGELCYMGACKVTGCTNGQVDADEICDSQPGCDADCLGPQPCNPLSNFGCGMDELCLLDADVLNEEIDVHCQVNFGPRGPGEVCGVLYVCDKGLACTSKELAPACDATGEDGCCVAACDLGADMPCAAGSTCVAYEAPSGFPLVPALGFLGVCIPD